MKEDRKMSNCQSSFMFIRTLNCVEVHSSTSEGHDFQLLRRLMCNLAIRKASKTLEQQQQWLERQRVADKDRSESAEKHQIRIDR